MSLKKELGALLIYGALSTGCSSPEQLRTVRAGNLTDQEFQVHSRKSAVISGEYRPEIAPSTGLYLDIRTIASIEVIGYPLVYTYHVTKSEGQKITRPLGTCPAHIAVSPNTTNGTLNYWVGVFNANECSIPKVREIRNNASGNIVLNIRTNGGQIHTITIPVN